ncbi:hypothetical protein H8Z72_22775 (plasmid) [Xanthomonas citri pv. citri]|uniref:hypothetical protein n=1 Tax=Xanthomonas citri TaxID=346 RepID=UPI0019315F7E|nr:hypothetical protein [Xanthomonas citri]QRD62645.1 hypothetical protein H8Z74_23410 [Xanthomonas citri pv. citri]QRD67180.1 hypothetical protein H8Z73_22390 [Xanthomonas citri pv. citri]QRD71775.1 hypothetical protein H8Z72_22775 [Xanthomonas citri pv. citri]
MIEGKRQTMRLGSRITTLLGSGACAASSVPKRLDILAGRFQHIMSTTKAPSWPSSTWSVFLKIAQQTDLSQDGAVFAIQGHAKALGESRLTFALESLSPAQQILLMVIAEQYFAHQVVIDPELVEPFLESLGHAVSAATKP